MKIIVNLPSMRVACDKCRHGTEPLDANVQRTEIEIGCKCSIPELMLVLGFRGRAEPIKLPLETADGGK